MSITHEDLAQFGVRVKDKVQLSLLLGKLHPHMDWSKMRGTPGRLSEQRHLERIINQIFPVHYIYIIYLYYLYYLY